MAVICSKGNSPSETSSSHCRLYSPTVKTLGSVSRELGCSWTTEMTENKEIKDRKLSFGFIRSIKT